MFRKFRFEESIYPDLKHIPMSTCFKLDRAGIRLDQGQWAQFSLEERRVLCHLSVRSQGESKCYRDYLCFLLKKQKGSLPKAALEVRDPEAEEWENLGRIPEVVYLRILKMKRFITPQEWIDLDDLERYVLYKLAQEKQNDEVLAQAYEEFFPQPGTRVQRIS